MKLVVKTVGWMSDTYTFLGGDHVRAGHKEDMTC